MNGQLEVPFDKDRRRQSYELSQEHLMVNKVIVSILFFYENRFVPLAVEHGRTGEKSDFRHVPK